MKNNMAKQITINIQCDEGFCADTLRELANRFENEETNEFEYETEHAYIETYEE